MKKIKKKKSSAKKQALPAFVIGFTLTDPPPPGYLAAWFNQLYGGPLDVRFTSQTAHAQFEAVHTSWHAGVNTDLPQGEAENWQERLQWTHSRQAAVYRLQNMGQDKRDVTLHVARIARGMTLLTEGTAYDVVAGSFFNPSDWNDRQLDQFEIADHVQVEQQEQSETMSVWFSTRGLAKFGFEEIETFRPLGLPERPTIDTLLEIGEWLITENNVPKVGDQLTLPWTHQVVTVIRHRTDQSSGRLLQLREVKWQ